MTVQVRSHASESTRIGMMPTKWDREYWAPEKLWDDKTVFVLGGGPSLKDLNPDQLKGQHVLVINSACKLVPWADVLLFLDQVWFLNHQQEIARWKGLAITTSIGAKRMMPLKLKRLQAVLYEGFEIDERYVRMGPSGGHVGISLAIAMGAKRVVLLGMDMKLDPEGNSHFHQEYPVKDDKVYRNKFIPGFKDWDLQAKRVGVEILNATPDSALNEFKKVSLQDILAQVT